MRLEDFDTGTTYNARVLSSKRITAASSSEEVREIVLEVERDQFAYQPGQSIGVIVSGNHPQGHKHHFRLYSVADTSPRRQLAATPGHPLREAVQLHR